MRGQEFIFLSPSEYIHLEHHNLPKFWHHYHQVQLREDLLWTDKKSHHHPEEHVDLFFESLLVYQLWVEAFPGWIEDVGGEGWGAAEISRIIPSSKQECTKLSLTTPPLSELLSYHVEKHVHSEYCERWQKGWFWKIGGIGRRWTEGRLPLALNLQLTNKRIKDKTWTGDVSFHDEECSFAFVFYHLNDALDKTWSRDSFTVRVFMMRMIIYLSQ